MDIFPLLDEIQTIARNGLAFSENPYDRERYERLLTLASQYYGQALNLPAEDVQQRLSAELGYITPKVGASGAIFDDAGRILLLRRADDNTWNLPGGWVAPNEAPMETAVREMLEETGMEARVVQLVNVFTCLPGVDAGPHTTIGVVYLCEAIGGALQLSRESVEARYCHIREVRDWHRMHRAYALEALGAWRQWREREQEGLEALPEARLPGEWPQVTIYTDGACKGKPGPGGYAAVLMCGQQREEIAGGFRLTTNARMEMIAVIRALKRLRDPSIVQLYTDSKMIVNAMEQGDAKRWRDHGWKRNRHEEVVDADLWEKLLEVSEQHQVRFFWVKGHAGNVENNRCDRLSVRAALGPRLMIDAGFENTIIQRLGLAQFAEAEFEAEANAGAEFEEEASADAEFEEEASGE